MSVNGVDNLREQAYRMAEENTKCNEAGRPVISENDEWNKETEWEDMFHK